MIGLPITAAYYERYIKIMKLNQSIQFILVSLFLWHSSNILPMLSVSSYKPESYFQKPYFDQDYFTNISTIFSGGSANQAFNSQGTKVPYLEQFGPENLLAQFTDATISNNDTNSFGLGKLNGNFSAQELILTCYKNMEQGFFMQGAIVIQNLTLSNISINYMSTAIEPTPEQMTYLEQLLQKIPTTMQRSGMFTTAYYVGYRKTFSHFTHLDFIDFTIKTGFTSPQSMTNTAPEQLLQFPFLGNLNFGYPIIATAALGLLDWMNIGINCSITPWQKTTKLIPLSSINSHNNLLLPESGFATIQRGPLITGSLYFQADHFHEGFSALVGYCYVQNIQYHITPVDQTKFPMYTINQLKLYDSWSFGSFYIQGEIDFATETHPNAPVIIIFCNIPVRGYLTPKTNIFGGSCNLQLSYAF
ncbi:MAG: hypothetical protein ACXWL5_01480 [Candidatus Chromulinivorax sp.]